MSKMGTCLDYSIFLAKVRPQTQERILMAAIAMRQLGEGPV